MLRNLEQWRSTCNSRRKPAFAAPHLSFVYCYTRLVSKTSGTHNVRSVCAFGGRCRDGAAWVGLLERGFPKHATTVGCFAQTHIQVVRFIPPATPTFWTQRRASPGPRHIGSLLRRAGARSCGLRGSKGAHLAGELGAAAAEHADVALELHHLVVQRAPLLRLGAEPALNHNSPHHLGASSRIIQAARRRTEINYSEPLRRSAPRPTAGGAMT